MWLSLFNKPFKDKVNEDITVTVTTGEAKSLLYASITEMIGVFLYLSE